jgi:type I restriction enzyme S subunit
MKKAFQTRALGDVCRIIGGGTPSKSVVAYYTGDIPWATIRDMTEDLLCDTDFRITKAAVEASSTNVIPGGNVVMACRVGLGKVSLLAQDTAINQDLRAVIPFDTKILSIRFLYWWFKSIADYIENEGKGATVKGVTLPFIKSLQIPDLPLSEQRRIVGILDEVFEGIGTAKANAEKNLQNARALFESHLQYVFTQRGLGWVEKRLGDESLLEIIDGDRGVNYPKTSDFHDDGHCLFLNTKNVRPDGFEFETTTFITAEKDGQLRKGKLKRDDVVLTTRGTIGNIGLYSEDVPFYHIRINSGMLVFRPNKRSLLPSFLFELLRSEIVKEQIRKQTTGAAQPQLPIKTLVNFKIPVPTNLDDQRALVTQIRAFEPETQRLESLYQRKLAALDELKKSLLHQAFTGQL